MMPHLPDKLLDGNSWVKACWVIPMGRTFSITNSLRDITDARQWIRGLDRHCPLERDQGDV